MGVARALSGCNSIPRTHEKQHKFLPKTEIRLLMNSAHRFHTLIRLLLEKNQNGNGENRAYNMNIDSHEFNEY